MQSSSAGLVAPSGGSIPGSRPRLLALHGWRTSAAVLTQQLQRSGLDRVLGEVAEIVCLDAPHRARGPPTPDVQRVFHPPFFEWWDAVQGDTAAGVVRYEGVEETLSLLVSELRRAAAAGQPVAGLLGFSQGALLAGLVMTMQERREAAFLDTPPLRCAILIGGGVVRDPAFAYLYSDGGSSSSNCSHASSSSSTSTSLTTGADGANTDKLSRASTAAATAAAIAATPPQRPALISKPTCHLIGCADPLRRNSETLASLCQQPIVLRHDQGHVVPYLAAELRGELLDFLRAHLLPAPPTDAQSV